MVDENAEDEARNVSKMARDQLSSRRGFLAGTTALGAGTLVAGGFGNVMAAEHGDDSGGDGGSDGSDGSGDETSNVEVLNYALTLEHLEAVYYEQGVDEFSDSELRNAEVLCDLNEELNEGIPARFREIRDHELAHEEQLTQVIEELGGDPVERAEYEFPYETPSEFIELAATFETTGVSAYDGAINLLSADALLTASATIATVEGRHSAYLNVLTDKSPFPRAFDEAKSMDEIKEIISDFIVSE